MDIILEAFEAHSIEKNVRIEKYKERYDKDMEEKISKWNEICNKYKEDKHPNHEDFNLMIKEIDIYFYKNKAEDYPYLKEHIDRIKSEQQYQFAIEVYSKLIKEYHEFIKSTSNLFISIFSKKKQLNSIIEEATSVIKRNKDNANKIHHFIDSEYYFEDELNNKMIDLDKIKGKLSKDNKLSIEEKKWLMAYSKYSILEQQITGDLFFAHHFDRVRRKERYNEILKAFKEVFLSYDKVVGMILETKNNWLERKYTLERIIEECRDAKYDVISEYRKIERYLQD